MVTKTYLDSYKTWRARDKHKHTRYQYKTQIAPRFCDDSVEGAIQIQLNNQLLQNALAGTENSAN